MFNKEKIFHCNEFRIIGEIKKVRYELIRLPGGYIVCDIKITNPFDTAGIPVECRALIDTGCDVSIICESVYKQFTIDETRVERIGVLTIHGIEKDAVLYPFKVNIPNRNWKGYCGQLAVANLSDRKGYSAIIGIDFLRNFTLYCDCVKGMAWLED